jgi:Protein of unknown function (DUF3800)
MGRMWAPARESRPYPSLASWPLREPMEESKLAMFTAYVDDSGTDPRQPVAVASALIIPASRILALEREWDRLKAKEEFSEWHTSEFVAKNAHSDFANWDDEKGVRVFGRVRQIAKKYGVKALAFSIYKKDYDEAIPADLKKYSGEFHYTWAVQHLLDALFQWRKYSGCASPLTFVFDWMESKDERRREIEDALDQAEQIATEVGCAGEYTNISFGRRRDIPGLQCADALAWTSYQTAQLAFCQKPLRGYASVARKDFGNHPTPHWREAFTIKRSELERWVGDPSAVAHTKKWFSEWAAQKAKRGGSTLKRLGRFTV